MTQPKISRRRDSSYRNAALGLAAICAVLAIGTTPAVADTARCFNVDGDQSMLVKLASSGLGAGRFVLSWWWGGCRIFPPGHALIRLSDATPPRSPHGSHPPPPPPPSPPPPPLPPPPPPPVKTFIMFFDFDKSNLTDKAQEVVAEAVRVAKANGFVKVLVTGHTDTVGSDNYNQALSVRRGQEVKDEMVREGLDASGIEIEGKSFHDPLVPTGPGVREPQNRRAVIDLGG